MSASRSMMLLCSLLLVSCGSDTGSDDDDVAEVDGSPISGADSAPTPPDAPPVVTPDADPSAPDADPSVDPRAGVVECDGNTCDLSAGEVCCISISGSQCTLEADCGGGFSAPQHCDGPEDCDPSANKCCAVFSFGGDVGSFCRAECDTNEAGDTAEICHDNDDCPDSGDTCKTCEYPGAPPTNACAGDDIPACQS